MCWNADVSFNTFIFSMFVLVLIMYNNRYTQYKIPGFDWRLALYFFSFIIMQLIEYFMWTSGLQIWTYVALIVIYLQPIWCYYCPSFLNQCALHTLFYRLLHLLYILLCLIWKKLGWGIYSGSKIACFTKFSIYSFL